MTWGAIAVGGATLIGGLAASDAQRSAGNNAADAQRESSAAAIAEQQRQFDAIRQLLLPYVNAGGRALSAQKALIGLNGPADQAKALKDLERSPEFTTAIQQGENAILQNASATGGLRGGNTQAALAQFRPQLLAQLINDQYGRLGGLTSLGQNAAVGVGNAGMQTGNSISQLLQQQGAAIAGGALSGGAARAGAINSAVGAFGTFAGMGGFKNFGGTSAAGGGLVNELAGYGVF